METSEYIESPLSQKNILEGEIKKSILPEETKRKTKGYLSQLIQSLSAPFSLKKSVQDIENTGSLDAISKKPLIKKEQTTKDTLLVSQKSPEQKEYMLSPEDYDTYFEGDNFEQSNLGDCYLLAAIDSYMSWGMAESVTRESVQVIKNQNNEVESFHFFLPLGAPQSQAKEYIVTKEMLVKYKSNETKLAKQGMKEGLLALLIAYGQISTGKTDFDPKLLNAGFPSNVSNTLIFGVNTYSISRDRKSKESFLHGLEYVLKSFNKKTDMLSFSTNMSSLQVSKNWVEKMRKSSPQVWKQNDYNGHAFAVDSVYTDNDGKTFISFSNPWTASSSITLPLEEFSQLVQQYYFSSTRTADELGNDEAKRMLLEQGYSNENDVGKRQAINQVGLTSDVSQMKEIEPVTISVPNTPTEWKQDEKFGEQYQEWELPNSVTIRKYDSGRIERQSVDQFDVVRRDGSTFRGKPLQGQLSSYEGIYTKTSGDRLEGVFNDDGRLVRGRRMIPLKTGRTQLEVGTFDPVTENLAVGERNMVFSDGKVGIRKGAFDTNNFKANIIWGADILGKETRYLSNGMYVGWPSGEMRKVREKVQTLDPEIAKIKTEVDQLDTSLQVV